MAKITSKADFDAAIANNQAVVFFSASWHEPCKQIAKTVNELATQYATIKFLEVDAEEVADVADAYQLQSVPTFVCLQNGKVVQRLEGANIPKFVTMVQEFSRASPAEAAPQANAGAVQMPVAAGEDPLTARLRKLLSQDKIMLFMKGSPSRPQCGFSREIVAILEKEGVKYSSFDILTDDEVRQGLKTFSNWKTYPQLYANGELLGGLDVVREMHEEGELKSALA